MPESAMASVAAAAEDGWSVPVSALQLPSLNYMMMMILYFKMVLLPICSSLRELNMTRFSMVSCQ